MTSQQIKLEIQKSLDEVPESILMDILNYLREAKDLSVDQAELARRISRIFKDDHDLLTRLAK